MKQKSNIKINQVILISLMVFLGISLILLFLMQIISLDEYYKIYKTKQLNVIVDKIKNDDNITNTTLEDIAYEYGVCISVYQDESNKAISTFFNKGCIFSDKKSSEDYINRFIDEGKIEDTYLIENRRFRNKTIIKGLKYKKDTFIFINTSIEPLDSSIEIIKSQYVFIVLILFMVSIILAFIISKQISKPIEKISDAAKNLAKGRFDTKFETSTYIKEINELGNTLEQARNELSKTDELRRDLMANVGHDLRTPLTMIKAYAEMTRDLDGQTSKKKKENLNIIIEETDRLNVLVSDILDLSKLQSKTYELKIETFDLNMLIKSILKRYFILIDYEGYEFIYNNDKTINVSGDKKRIEQVIYNLINNAINYTGEDKKIFINLIEKDSLVIVEIQDTGKGIDKKELNYIWNKYYHNEKKHKRNAFGTGLGLSIVKTILDTHNYNYGVRSKKGKGTTFYFEIEKK